MSQQVARAHTSQSNRAKARDNSERKAAIKSVVANPFHVQWPSVPVNVQNAVFACVVDILGGVAEHNLEHEHSSRKRRRSRRFPHADRSKRAKVDHGAVPTNPAEAIGGSHDIAIDVDALAVTPSPPVLSSLTVGINEVTKRLEVLAASHRSQVETRPDQEDSSLNATPTSSPPSRLVIACRADIDPPILMGHIPNLVATCNSARRVYGTDSPQSGGTWLVPMPKGTEETLSAAMGLRRVSILLVESSAPKYSALAPLLQKIPLLSAPWLSSAATRTPARLVPTHIKQLRTSAPKDMKAAKEKRSKERTAAKERRRATLPQKVTVSAT
ncbi:hypothetical protein LXA43DRAFT_1019482 [Ganoderma leucocontextum]|nr:hypothetical protein LXA43DRAFT_1019482 [Ganoderma leucocontextum]